MELGHRLQASEQRYQRQPDRERPLLGPDAGYTPELSAKLGIPGTLRLLSFYDFGTGFNSHLGGGTTPSNINVASIGVGARYTAGKDFNVRADLARLTIPGRTSTIDPPSVRRGDWRAHISAVLGF